MARRSSLVLLVSLTLAGGCYAGSSAFDTNGDGPAGSDGGGDGDGDAGGDGGDGDGDGDDPCAGPLSVAHTPLRRLSNTEYTKTVSDLLGFEGDHAAGFTPDEKVGAFYSNSIAPISELTVEDYQKRAEELADQADIAFLSPCPDLSDPVCADDFVESFGRRAFRRPLDGEELARYRNVFDVGSEQEGAVLGARLVVQAMLQSPHFLYHVELAPNPGAGPDEVVALDEYELASRLSYFLWGSMPDDELLDVAGSGTLSDPDVLTAQATRLLDSDKAYEAVGTFHLQWLHVDGIEAVEKDLSLFPVFTPEVQAAMKDETVAFSNYVLRQDDGTLETLLTAPFTVSNMDAIFDVYDVETPVDWQPGDKVELDPTRRAGLLTQPALLAANAHANQTSPIHRGVLIRENFLCQPLPPPPPDVDDTPPEIDPDATTRERYEQHKSDPTCAGCHVLIDDLGFGLEHYDAVGAWRDDENGLAIDATGTIIGLDEGEVTFDGGIDLANALADSPTVHACFSRQWLRFALGRNEQSEDACTIQTIETTFADSGNNIRSLLEAIVQSDAFRHRRATQG